MNHEKDIELLMNHEKDGIKEICYTGVDGKLHAYQIIKELHEFYNHIDILVKENQLLLQKTLDKITQQLSPYLIASELGV